MPSRIRRPRIDPLIVLILLAVLLAVVLPVRDETATVFSAATKMAIALLFFVYGARLSTPEALAGLRHWRLHLAILAFTYVVFPLIGVALMPFERLFPTGLFLGIVYLTLVPSTVQSSVAFTSIARGNVAGAIISASASNLLGVVLTPLLVMLLMSQGGHVQVSGQVFLDIAIQLLLPFFLGQLVRPWIRSIVSHSATKIIDRGSITMVVYSAFSAGMVEGIWSRVTPLDLMGLVLFSVALVAFMLWLTRFGAQRLGFNRADTLAIQFCGTKKSLATGLPMAAVIFGTGELGLLILPLMIFHQVQLMMCAALASHYADDEPDHETSRGTASHP
ncbi:bile acid:sodium symporter [Corynebacterium sp. P5848]|uniref:bile acid:sodium symporter family protein n=1 Tax=Corynebacterium marambiense TaxID=2765364 RepID=UPI002260C467|nr:bile acid:sodium symporter family protein [Corynebacterium marambiense]MCX7543680.1 bile acid:sodium symporter [Corynebacterium marambiense]